MKVEQMISFLRQSVYIQSPDSATQDSAYLCMTDEDLLLYMNFALSRNFSDVPSLDNLPEEDVYPLLLLSKMELYSTLAVKEAPLVDIGADNNNYLKRSQRFDHYMALLKQAKDEYDDWLENGGDEDGIGTVRSYSVTLSDRYNTRYNYENGAIPKVTLYTDVVGLVAKISWKVRYISRFYRYKVYISTSPIVDLYDTKNHIASGSTLLAEISDVRQTAIKATGLSEGTTYYIAVQAISMAGLSGYAQTSFTTDAPEEDGEESGT